MSISENKRNWLFASFSGILLALSFPPIPFPFLAFVAFVPILFVFSQSEKIRYRYLVLYLTFFIYHVSSQWWISSWAKETDPFLMIAGLGLDIFHPLFFLFPFWLFFFVKKRLGTTIALTSFPFLFLSFEWLHSLGDMAFPWLTIGNTQISNIYWIQFIDITGIWGASFLILCINVVILKFIILFLNSKEKKFLSFVINNRKSTYYLISIVLLLFLPYFYSFYIIKKYDYSENLKKSKNITIAIVQPNINPWEKWTGSPIKQLLLHQKIADSLLNKQNNIDLFLWSETAVPFLFLDFNSFKDVSLLTDWINHTKVPLLTGFSEFEFIRKGEIPPRWSKHFEFDTTQHYMTYNAAVLLEPDNQYSDVNKPQTYHKSKLTPFGELFPYKDIFPYLAEKLMWSVGISNWNIGTGADILKLNVGKSQVKVGNIICIESIHPAFVIDYIRKGANILTVITNDGWYDHTTGPRQHYLLSCIRAIENRRYIARIGNTGVSGFISPLGTSMSELSQYSQGAEAMTLPLIEDKTLYVKYGNWLPYLSASIAVLFLIFSIFTNVKKN